MSTIKSPSNFTQLPPECLVTIANYLDETDRTSTRCTSQGLRRATLISQIDPNQEIFWRIMEKNTLFSISNFSSTIRPVVCIATLKGHTNAVWSVNFNLDGSQIFSGSLDTTMRTWDITSGRHIASLRGYKSHNPSVVFSPDGSQIVSGSSDNTIRIHYTFSGLETGPLKGHKDIIFSVAFSPDQSQIVSGSRDNTIGIWNTYSGRHIAWLTGHTAPVRSVAFSPDGSQIVSGSEDKTIKIWNVDSGRCTASLTGHTGTVLSVAFSTDGSQIVSGSEDKTIKIWSFLQPEERMIYVLSGKKTILPKFVQEKPSLLEYATKSIALSTLEVIQSLTNTSQTQFCSEKYIPARLEHIKAMPTKLSQSVLEILQNNDALKNLIDPILEERRRVLEERRRIKRVRKLESAAITTMVISGIFIAYKLSKKTEK